MCTDQDSNVVQQLQEAGQELQEDEIDNVLKRCEQLSSRLREALKTQEKDRCCFLTWHAPLHACILPSECA